MEKLIQNITDGALWLMIIVSMLSVTVLIGAGTYSLITGPELADLLLFIGAGASLIINLMLKRD